MAMRVMITAIALTLLLAHRHAPWFNTKDNFEIALGIVAVLPWLNTIFKSVEIPGVGKFELQEIKKQLNEQSDKITSMREEVVARYHSA
jgi:hypothetical protein